MTATTSPSSPPADSPPIAAPRGPRSWLLRGLARFGAVLQHWQPSRGLIRTFAWAAVLSNGLITVTGAVVRVTGSGLGCSTWPNCQPGSLVPVDRSGMAAIHQAIEFGNRTITGIVLVASLGTFILLALRRPARRQLLWIAAIGPVGVLFQAVWGGIVVFTGLRWWTVAPHLLASVVLLFAAVVTLVRLREGDGPARPSVPRPLQVLAWATAGVLGLVTVVGTLVTAAGPHAGDADTPRLMFLSVRDLAQFHADLVFLFLGMLIAMTVGFIAVHASRRLLVRTGILIAATAAQGTIGYTQYYLGVPEVLVILHVLGVVVLVAVAASVVMATRTRGSAPVGQAVAPAEV